MTDKPAEVKATITLDTANNDRQFPAYQLSINAVTSETSGHGYRLMGPKYVGRSRNIRTVELSQRDADEIRGILDEAFPPNPNGQTDSLRSALAAIVKHGEMSETVRQEIRSLIED